MTNYNRICPRCGKAFETNHPRKKYCSQPCALEVRRDACKARDAARVRLPPERPCDWCGLEFIPNKRHRAYCSDDCAAAGGRKKRQRLDQKRYRSRKRLSVYDRRHPRNNKPERLRRFGKAIRDAQLPDWKYKEKMRKERDAYQKRMRRHAVNQQIRAERAAGVPEANSPLWDEPPWSTEIPKSPVPVEPGV